MAWNWYRLPTSNLAVLLAAITIDLPTPVTASAICNNGMELLSKRQRPTSQVSLAAILLVSGSCNNGMEMVSTTQRPTSQYRSPPCLELGDARPVKQEQANNSRPRQYTADGRAQHSIRSSTTGTSNNIDSNKSRTNTSPNVKANIRNASQETEQHLPLGCKFPQRR